MKLAAYSEDTLVHQTTAEYLEEQLGWESVYAYNNEDFGPDSLLGRASDREVVLTRTLRQKLVELNPDLPEQAYDDAMRQIAATVASQTISAANREKRDLIRDGVQVTFCNEKGERVRQRLLNQNPLRTDFQQHYEKIVAEYNREKDRVTIEQTFEALLKLVQKLDEEESRAVREGLDEESLAIFDLLKKQDLDASDIKRIKTVAVGLLEKLKAEKLRVDQWRDKEATRDAVRVTIRDFLWSDQSGLPVALYSEDEVNIRVENVFRHVFRAYPTVPSPYYEAAA